MCLCLYTMSLPQTTSLWHSESYLSEGLWLTCEPKKNRFNTLSSYKLVSYQSHKRYSIYLQKRDIAQENCQKFTFIVWRTLSDSLVLYRTGCSSEFRKNSFKLIWPLVFAISAKTQQSAGKLSKIVENLNFLSKALLFTCGCYKEPV